MFFSPQLPQLPPLLGVLLTSVSSSPCPPSCPVLHWQLSSHYCTAVSVTTHSSRTSLVFSEIRFRSSRHRQRYTVQSVLPAGNSVLRCIPGRTAPRTCAAAGGNPSNWILAPGLPGLPGYNCSPVRGAARARGNPSAGDQFSVETGNYSGRGSENICLNYPAGSLLVGFLTQ